MDKLEDFSGTGGVSAVVCLEPACPSSWNLQQEFGIAHGCFSLLSMESVQGDPKSSRIKTPLMPWEMESGSVGILGFGTLGTAAWLGVPIPCKSHGKWEVMVSWGLVLWEQQQHSPLPVIPLGGKLPLIPWEMECAAGGGVILGFGTLGMAARLGVPSPVIPVGGRLQAQGWHL